MKRSVAAACSLCAVLALVSCSRSGSDRPATPPVQPSQPLQPAAPPSGQSTTPAGSAPLQQHLRSAADLFNRGENDLACEQVNQATALSGSSAAPTSEQLQRFQQACSQP